jgi:hypothetical protein
VQIEQTRGEILRLVARLRASQLAGGVSAQPAKRPVPVAAPARTWSTRPPARRFHPPAPDASTASTGAARRLHERQQQLGEIRRVRERLEDRSVDVRGFREALERIENRLMALEQTVGRLRVPSSRPPRLAPSGSFRGRSQTPRRTVAPPAPDEPSADDLAGCAFSGRIQGQMLSDMLQLVSSNGMSGVFFVTVATGRIELYFDEGRMCHATGPGVVGELAFFSAFGADDGHYWFRETDELPEERTIDGSTQLLILEALRQIDEQTKD